MENPPNHETFQFLSFDRQPRCSLKLNFITNKKNARTILGRALFFGVLVKRVKGTRIDVINGDFTLFPFLSFFCSCLRALSICQDWSALLFVNGV